MAIRKPPFTIKVYRYTPDHGTQVTGVTMLAENMDPGAAHVLLRKTKAELSSDCGAVLVDANGQSVHWDDTIEQKAGTKIVSIKQRRLTMNQDEALTVTLPDGSLVFIKVGGHHGPGSYCISVSEAELGEFSVNGPNVNDSAGHVGATISFRPLPEEGETKP